MKVKLITQEGIKDITELTIRTIWSGDFTQVSRKLQLSIAVSPNDYFLPKVFIGLGNMLKLYNDQEQEIFQGYVFFKEKSHQGNELRVVAYDGLIYLTKSKASYNFQKITADNITKKVCSDLGIPIGQLAPASLQQSFIAMGKSGYEIIMKAYTEESRQSGKIYMPMIKDGKLHVIQKGSLVASKTLDSREDLTDSSYSEDIESMISQVIITDENGNKINTIKDETLAKNYGLIQAVYQKEKDKDANTIGKALIHGIDRNANVESLGHIDCISGNAVMIKDAYTGLTGLFYIDRDTHTWENGHHTMSLGLNFKNIMDSQE